MLRGADNLGDEPGSGVLADAGELARRVRHNGRWGKRSRRRRGRQESYAAGSRRGFTLLELMIVISMMLILMSIAIPMYTQSVQRARESVLRQDLFTLRSVISQYTLDKAKAPQGLEDLTQAGYLHEIPKDPMTQQANWEVVQEDVLLAVDQQQPGITDVKSASNLTASDGTAYSTW
ncbi:MAG TPA: prepilin-type N-terminal cleavage/methylation domain-containing protein [Terriglobales bacterium]|nr:prepilin-type N-terminal cleavage/methylation domain-containing protein [Terriglobales bacterium]